MTAIPHPMSAAHEHDHAHAHGHEDMGFLKKYVYSMDHKIIGIQFLFVGLLFMVVGGLLAMLIRWQLAWPSDPSHPVPILGKIMGWTSGIMPPEFYNMVFTMHASIMIFFVIIVLLVGTFGNYLIPLKIGAGDMAFPFLNGLAFWFALPAGTIMLTGFFLPGNAASAGWTSYPTLSSLQYNGVPASIPDFSANFLRPGNSNWPMAAVIMNFIAAAACVGYICAYYVHLGNKALNIGVS